MGLLERLIAPLLDKLKQVFAPFRKVLDLVARFVHNVANLRNDVQSLASLVVSEIDAWKNFKENIAFRTRVINVRSAIEHIGDFWDEIRGAWAAVVDLWEQLRETVSETGGGNPEAEARAAIEDIEASGFSGILRKLPKLGKVFEKALGIIALVADGLEQMVTFVADMTTIVNALRDIRLAVETGEQLFLKQSNARRIETLADGTKIKIRLGKLHQ